MLYFAAHVTSDEFGFAAGRGRHELDMIDTAEDPLNNYPTDLR